MAGERRLNWGADATDAQYRTGDDAANNRFVLAEDLDGGTILLEYDETASEWVSRGPVNLSGNDVSNVGTLSATAVNTESLTDGAGTTHTEELADASDVAAITQSSGGFSPPHFANSEISSYNGQLDTSNYDQHTPYGIYTFEVEITNTFVSSNPIKLYYHDGTVKEYDVPGNSTVTETKTGILRWVSKTNDRPVISDIKLLSK
jgi:hypothetical protein